MKVKTFNDIFDIYPEKQKEIKEKIMKKMLAETWCDKKDYNGFYNYYKNYTIKELKERLKRLKFENQYTWWWYWDIDKDYNKFCNS